MIQKYFAGDLRPDQKESWKAEDGIFVLCNEGQEAASINNHNIEVLSQRIATLAAENEHLKTIKHAEIALIAAENERLREAIDTILPMAKGYAAEHNVGRNQEMVNEVSDLKQTEGGGE